MPRHSPRTAYLMLALVMLLWSGNSIVARAVSGAVPPFALALFRWTGALLILLPVAWPRLRADRNLLAAHWRPVLLLGLLGVAAFNAFLYSGLRYTTASNGLLLQAAIPALVLLVDFALFRARAPLGLLLGVPLSILGVAAIVAQGRPSTLAHVAFNRGDALILAGIVAWSLYTSLLRLRPTFHPLSFLAATFAIGVAAMLPLAATEAQQIAAIRWTPGTIAAVAYVAVFPSVIAYALFNAAVSIVGPASAGQAITLMPLFGALLASVTLGEKLHGYHLAGMALILGGILVSALVRPRGTNPRERG